jgi:hypothetical protein
MLREAKKLRRELSVLLEDAWTRVDELEWFLMRLIVLIVLFS